MDEKIFEAKVRLVYNGSGQLLENYFYRTGSKNFLNVVNSFCADDYCSAEVYFEFIHDIDRNTNKLYHKVIVSSFNYDDEIYPATDFFTLLFRLCEGLYKDTKEKQFLECMHKVKEKLDVVKSN